MAQRGVPLECNDRDSRPNVPLTTFWHWVGEIVVSGFMIGTFFVYPPFSADTNVNPWALKETMKLDWLEDGNLTIVLPEPLLGVWHGKDSDDYDRACASSNSWLNSISVPGGLGFLLGGDVGMVLALPGEQGETSIIRWVYAQDEHDLVEFALQGKSVTRSEPDFIFRNTCTKWWLFNAAARPSLDSPEMRSISLPLGQLRIETAYCEGRINAAIVHRFSKIG